MSEPFLESIKIELVNAQRDDSEQGIAPNPSLVKLEISEIK